MFDRVNSCLKILIDTHITKIRLFMGFAIMQLDINVATKYVNLSVLFFLFYNSLRPTIMSSIMPKTVESYIEMERASYHMIEAVARCEFQRLRHFCLSPRV